MTFIIAEVGSNWENLQDCLDSIVWAKNCGADAVKFQMFSPWELYGDHLGPDALTFKIKDWLPTLRSKADAVGIELMCTAFSEEGVDYVDQFVKRHKIASAELSHLPLLKRVREKNKPVLLSTGGSSINDVSLALQALKGVDVTLLYCVSAYPAVNVNLFGIDLLKAEFPGVKVGYSCHTADTGTAVAAHVYHKAYAIEKHFKIREMTTPDNDHSLGPWQFKHMVKQIRGRPVDHVVFPDLQEMAMLLKHNRRLIATTAIEPGDSFRYGENFGVYRSLVEDRKGLTGFVTDRVNGTIALRSIKAGEPIGPGDFKPCSPLTQSNV